MGKIGEWREILRSAAERAAFWARLSWEEGEKEREGRRFGAESDKNEEKRESGEAPREGKELWRKKEEARVERAERVSGARRDARRSVGEDNEKRDVRRSAEEREIEREDIRERFEEGAEMRKGFAAGEMWRGRYELADELYERKNAELAAAGAADERRRRWESGEEILMRTAVGGAEELGLKEKRGYGAEGLPEEIVKGYSIEAVQRRLSYGGNAEMKRAMVKMRVNEERVGGEVKIEPVYNNYFESGADIDEIADRLTEKIVDMMARSADGVY